MPAFLAARTAVALARRGWPVLPCHDPVAAGCSCGHDDCTSPAKHPRLEHGLHDASRNPRLVAAWWRVWPTANPAVRTGARPDGAGVVVIDVDPGHGGEDSLAALVDVHGPVPATLEVATGGGGRHFYFAHPGGRLPNSAGRLGPGLDVRGDGGYVLVPPSRHPSGGRYRWRSAPLAPLPDWLHDLAVAEPEPVGPVGPPRSVRVPDAWARAALADEAARVRSAPEGRRNHTLNRAAFVLGQIAAGGALDPGVVAEILVEAAVAAGLGLRESRATVASGLRAGAGSPRRPLPR